MIHQASPHPSWRCFNFKPFQDSFFKRSISPRWAASIFMHLQDNTLIIHCIFLHPITHHPMLALVFVASFLFPPWRGCLWVRQSFKSRSRLDYEISSAQSTPCIFRNSEPMASFSSWKESATSFWIQNPSVPLNALKRTVFLSSDRSAVFSRLRSVVSTSSSPISSC